MPNSMNMQKNLHLICSFYYRQNGFKMMNTFLFTHYILQAVRRPRLRYH